MIKNSFLEQVCFCRKCGFALTDNKLCCSNCGTRTVIVISGKEIEVFEESIEKNCKNDNVVNDELTDNLSPSKSNTSAEKPSKQSTSSGVKPLIRSNYTVGDRVLHMAFGPGTIIKMLPMGGDYLIEIEFDNVGAKKLMLRAASRNMKKYEENAEQKQQREEVYQSAHINPTILMKPATTEQSDDIRATSTDDMDYYKWYDFDVGNRVLHTSFGHGMITKKVPMYGDYLIEVEFDEIGNKKLMLRAASRNMKKTE